MIHEILPVGALQCNCSIFGDEQTREAIVVDPGDEIEQIRQVLERHQLSVKAIVITHAHIDHIGGAAKLKKLTGAPVYMNENDVELRDQLDMQAGWLGVAPPEKPEIDVAIRDGDTVELNGNTFQVLHTPGHTQGSISLYLPGENKLIAGDTLFRDSIGRTDLPGGNGRQILVSIREKLLTLDDEVVVIPGTGRRRRLAASASTIISCGVCELNAFGGGAWFI
jgi:glyoxylase-like metal-dependent hydrolase (beta-lactamase superfamily II)